MRNDSQRGWKVIYSHLLENIPDIIPVCNKITKFDLCGQPMWSNRDPNLKLLKIRTK